MIKAFLASISTNSIRVNRKKVPQIIFKHDLQYFSVSKLGQYELLSWVKRTLLLFLGNAPNLNK